jgi:hypothetical protein
MDGQRWWIVDEIARWWRTASEEARGVLMQRAIEGTKEATLEEVQRGACIAELGECREALAEEARSLQFIEAWSSRERFRRR